MLFNFKNNVTSSTRIYRIVNENILEKQKIRRKEKNYDVIVPRQQERGKLEKNLYQREGPDWDRIRP